MDLESLKEIWLKEERHSFEGWDFSHINDRTEDEALPWDYKQIVKSYMGEDKMLLDMGTGGGEFLLSINPYPGKTYATESYPPNIELSKKVLTPYGIVVRSVIDDKSLPFEDDYFDIIINRHESFSLSEVKRILKEGGVFITQQVGGRNNKEMSKFLLGEYSKIIDFNFNLDRVVQEALNTGLKIIRKGEYFPKTRFFDVGALVYLAKIIEWEFPGFSVERCFDRLIELQCIIEKQGYIETMEHRFFLIAVK